MDAGGGAPRRTEEKPERLTDALIDKVASVACGGKRPGKDNQPVLDVRYQA